MKAFITGDELVRETKTRHETSLLKPKDGTEWTWEEYPFHNCEGNQSLSKRISGVDPLECPLRLSLNGRNFLNSSEQVLFLLIIWDIGIYEKGIHLRVDVLHHHLERVEGSCFRDLDLWSKFLSQIFNHDAITMINRILPGCEESEHSFDEFLLILIQLGPVGEVIGQTHLLGCPEGSHMLLIHFPQILVVDGENYKAIWIFL